MSSIPPKGSIPPNMRHQQRERTDSTLRGTIGRQHRDDLKPSIVRSGEQITRRTVAPPLVLRSWPDREDPEIIESENCVWVVVEFPRHRLEQIKWSNDGDLLTIESAIPSCSYINKIALPKNRGKRVKVAWNNGLFVATYERQHPS